MWVGIKAKRGGGGSLLSRRKWALVAYVAYIGIIYSLSITCSLSTAVLPRIFWLAGREVLYLMDPSIDLHAFLSLYLLIAYYDIP